MNPLVMMWLAILVALAGVGLFFWTSWRLSELNRLSIEAERDAEMHASSCPHLDEHSCARVLVIAPAVTDRQIQQYIREGDAIRFRQQQLDEESIWWNRLRMASIALIFGCALVVAYCIVKNAAVGMKL